MDTKKLALAALAGGVTLFVFGGLLYGLLFRSFVENNSAVEVASEPIFWAMILSQLVMGGFLAYIFGQWAGISTFAGGARAGGLIGFLLGIGIGFDLYSLGLMTLTMALVDPILWLVRYAVAGGVVGYVLGRGNS